MGLDFSAYHSPNDDQSQQTEGLDFSSVGGKKPTPKAIPAQPGVTYAQEWAPGNGSSFFKPSTETGRVASMLGSAATKGLGAGLDLLSYPFRKGMEYMVGHSIPTVQDQLAYRGYIDNPNIAPQGHAEKVGAGIAQGVGGAVPLAPLGGIGALVGGGVSGGVSEAAKDAGYNKTAQNVLGLATGGLTGSLGNLGSKAVNLATQAGPQGLMADYANVGVTPRLMGDVLDSPTAKMVQATLGKMPLSSGVVQNAANQTAAELAASIGNRAGNAPSTLQDLGETLQGHAKSYLDGLKAANNKNYAAIADHFDGGTAPVGLDNFLSTLDELAPQPKQGANILNSLVPDKFSALRSAINKDLPVTGSTTNATGVAENGLPITADSPVLGNTLPYSTVKDLRSAIGEHLANQGLMGDPASAGLKRLYGSLSDDILAAAPTDAAAQAITNANQVSKNGYQAVDDVISPILNKDPENAAQWAMAGMKKGSTRLSDINDAFTDPNIDQSGASALADIAGHNLKNMGVGPASNGSTFSPNTFGTNWNKLSPEAKDLMYSDPYFNSLDNVVSSMKSTNKYANTSNTATADNMMKLLEGGVVGHAMSAGALPSALQVGGGALTLGLPYGVSKAITNPSAVKFLSQESNVGVSPFLGGSILGSPANTGGILNQSELINNNNN